MECMLGIVLLLVIQVVQSAEELKICNSSVITQEKHRIRVQKSWEIDSGECESNKTMVMIQMIKVEVGSITVPCQAAGTVTGFNICWLWRGACIVVNPPDFSVKTKMLEECYWTRFRIVNNLFPVIVSYDSYSTETSFNLTYTIYKMADEEEHDTTIPSTTNPSRETSQVLQEEATSTVTVPHTETPQVTQKDTTPVFTSAPHTEISKTPMKSLESASALAIVFGILFGIASVAFSALLYWFLKQRREISEFHTSRTSPTTMQQLQLDTTQMLMPYAVKL